MLETLKKWVPITYEAFMDYRVGAVEVSAKGKILYKNLMSDKISLKSGYQENGMNMESLI